jgi:hypothetical protein
MKAYVDIAIFLRRPPSNFLLMLDVEQSLYQQTNGSRDTMRPEWDYIVFVLGPTSALFSYQISLPHHQQPTYQLLSVFLLLVLVLANRLLRVS